MESRSRVAGRRVRRVAVGLSSVAVALLAVSSVAGSAGAVATAGDGVRAARANHGSTECSADFYSGDRRLGPAALPKAGRVGLELVGYHRTGALSSSDFLSQYYDSTLYGGTGGWIYPPQNGYQLKSDGTANEYRKTLRPGRDLDRYGSEYGAFLSPTGVPYTARAIPPSNLDGTPAAGCNYHGYEVTKAFAVEAGPIAAWFAQPGGGLQFQLDAGLVPGAPSAINVLWLVDNGYLKRTG